MDASLEQGQRWVFPFYNVMGMRILPVPEHVTYFSDHGMPVSPALYERTGKYASSDDSAFYNDPRLEEFRTWTYRSGKTTYIRFLLSHPLYAITAPALQFPDIFLKDMSWFLSGHIDSGSSVSPSLHRAQRPARNSNGVSDLGRVWSHDLPHLPPVSIQAIARISLAGGSSDHDPVVDSTFMAVLARRCHGGSSA